MKTTGLLGCFLLCLVLCLLRHKGAVKFPHEEIWPISFIMLTTPRLYFVGKFKSQQFLK